MNAHTFAILPISAEETLPLRLAVLRPGLPRESALFAEDSRAVHFGAFAEGVLVCIASLLQENLPGNTPTGWRLRGMATAQIARGRGAGSAILQTCSDYATQRGGAILWCNARSEAAAFYAKNGFAIRGDEFEIAGVGPHFVMWKTLN